VCDAIPFLVPCALIGLASVPLMLGLVPPNKYYGVRTRLTLGNPEIWFRANCFAGWALFVAALVSTLIYVAAPDYRSGRSFPGLLAFVAPLAVALAATFIYLRRLRPRR
jgi:hypothetical protein